MAVYVFTATFNIEIEAKDEEQAWEVFNEMPHDEIGSYADYVDWDVLKVN